MKLNFLLALFLFFPGLLRSQKKIVPEKPRLVIGIVVDQMRYDYLYKYWEKYGNGGFKRLLSEGFSCKNTHYNYVPTYTGPGHAAIYTGTTPFVNGIIGNNWFERENGKETYVTADTTVSTVGSTSKEGKNSPHYLLSTTITDELRLFSNFKSKVIGIAMKDRGSILPAGHTPNASYWYDGATGNWITSTFYMQELPLWVQNFNGKKLPDQYLSKPWNTLMPIEKYWESLPDQQNYKQAYKGEVKNEFPHDLLKLKQEAGYGLLRATPFGNSFTLDFALNAIEAESLGKDEHTDFLALSFSSTDYIGHQFGIQSIEVEDTYLRLDKDIERLLNFLDKSLGKEQVVVFLTADHGAAYTPNFLIDHNIPAGIVDLKKITDSLEAFLQKEYGKTKWILYDKNQQLYLNQANIKGGKMLSEMKDRCKMFLTGIEGVSLVVFPETFEGRTDESLEPLQNGYHQKRSGDILISYLPGWYDDIHHTKGTTHGSGYAYDTHVPLLWYGWKIKKGSTAQKVNITDIAATLSGVLNIPLPSGCRGRSLEEEIRE